MCSGSEAGSYLRLIDSCITQLKAQGPARTCNESQEKEDTSVLLKVGAQSEVLVDQQRHYQPSEWDQMVLFECLHLYHKSPIPARVSKT